jgi:anti-anti-sigma factor
MERIELHGIIQDVLRRRAFDNRGMLPPTRLSQLGSALADMLLDQAVDLEQPALALSRQGLTLVSILSAGVALQRALLAASESERAMGVAERLAQLTIVINRAEIAAVREEQERTRAAAERALASQRDEASRLTSLIDELSTPIVPIYHGILVLPLIGSIDSRRSNEITAQLLNSISQHQADSVIIDITGVSVVDTSVAQHLLYATRAMKLLGTTPILVGISPEIAQTITQLGIEISELPTLSNLQAGITFALGKRGLAIRQTDRRLA